MLEIGKKAPDFTLLNQDNESMSLSDFKGKKVILYFYPRDCWSLPFLRWSFSKQRHCAGIMPWLLYCWC